MEKIQRFLLRQPALFQIPLEKGEKVLVKPAEAVGVGAEMYHYHQLQGFPETGGRFLCNGPQSQSSPLHILPEHILFLAGGQLLTDQCRTQDEPLKGG